MYQILQCQNCIHFSPIFNGDEVIGACEAYPNGIPTDILFEKKEHIVSNGDDNGIVFEPIQ